MIATDISELTQQDGGGKKTANRVWQHENNYDFLKNFLPNFSFLLIDFLKEAKTQ